MQRCRRRACGSGVDCAVKESGLMRGSRLILPLACAVLLSACAKTRLTLAGPPPINPSTAIALSVLAESVYLVDPVTGDRAVVASNLTDFQSGFATWAPDHRRLAYSDGGIVVLDTKTRRRHLFADGSSLSAPAWSHDGSRLAYGNGTTLWLTPAATYQPSRLRLPRTLAPLDMTWGPDSTIAFDGLKLTCDRLGSCLSTDRSEIWTVSADGSGLSKISHVGHAEKPKWSPDGPRLLFVARSGNKESELWIVGADGSQAKRLRGTSGVIAADWSPDGARIAVVRPGQSPRTLQLWIVDVDGNSEHAVGPSFPGLEATVDW
jgi:Tol biopolymer transport system component